MTGYNFFKLILAFAVVNCQLTTDCSSFLYAEKVVFMMDNLNTHAGSSLYETFEPVEAKRILDNLEIYYTPKHGSWLNRAEKWDSFQIKSIEIGSMVRAIRLQETLAGHLYRTPDICVIASVKNLRCRL